MRIKGLDYIRVLGIFLVVFYHFFSNFIPGGFLGVNILFVLSAFSTSSKRCVTAIHFIFCQVKLLSKDQDALNNKPKMYVSNHKQNIYSNVLLSKINHFTNPSVL